MCELVLNQSVFGFLGLALVWTPASTATPLLVLLRSLASGRSKTYVIKYGMKPGRTED